MSKSILLNRRSFVLMSLALAACKPGAEVLKITGLTMGTTYNVVALDANRSLSEAEVKVGVENALALVNNQMSNWDAGSEISRFNAQTGGAPVSVSTDLANVMRAAEDVNVASEGRFDTTMGPLIELWGFGANGQTQVPNADAIAAAKARSGHRDTLTVSPSALQKKQPDAQVYLSAIGKGFGADQVGRALEAFGITSYMVEIGGDIYASGVNADGLPWQIGIEKPAALSGGVMDVVGVSGLGLASSGDYRNYFEKDGERFSHIIDPVTGRPITHKTASATVLAENGMLADAWATAMLILGRERGLEIAEKNDLAVLFVERDAEAADLRFKSVASKRFADLKA
ncbi:FAD:protein FMN transferase [Shimia abyssi]|uniref:FAD:protein FMN transferase n=1 Tax=Shimia abyssi TaxID=1662395 RepID=A0A2P8F992_9RHOB|nr:FAD:protein FMN transferase [Shimia abyssi]PSL18284.1 thiamine biosynthesis lipoprotein [Shimia abyssi]